MRRLGGTAAMALGGTYLVYGLVFFLLPEGQQATGGSTLLASLVDDGTTGFVLSQWLLVLSGVLGIAVVGGFARVFDEAREGVVRWASALGFLGFGITIVDGFVPIAFVYQGAHQLFAEADEPLRSMIAGDLGASSVARQGWATFGLLGLWLLTISVLALIDRTRLRGPAALGVIGAVGYWLIPIGSATGAQGLITTAVVLAIVLAPVFYVWAGLALRLGADDA